MKYLYLLIFILSQFQLLGQKIDSILVEADDGPNWEYYSSLKYSYDINGYISNQLTKNWGAVSSPTPEWYPSESTDYFYNQDSLLEKTVTSWWNWTSSIWELQYQRINTYDLNNNKIESLSQSWNGSSWVNSTRYTYTYDGNNYLTGYLMEIWQGGSTWQEWSQLTYTNDANGIILEWLQQEWDASQSALDTTNKSVYTYTAFDSLSEINSFYWDGVDWLTTWKYSYTYDGNDYLTNLKWQYWDDNGLEWKNDLQFNYVNNWSGVLQYYIVQYWDDFNLVWSNAKKYTYNYLPYEAGINELGFGPKKIIKIYDLMGRETEDVPNTPLIYLYSDGTTKKVCRVE